MTKNKSLAIIIPAYKQQFLVKTLDSIANQTCKDFTLYIGDDASPEDLYSIISRYESRISISYKRFNENLGGMDLVSHWKRCVELTKTEEWLWLFSDDDVMDLTCVEDFYQHLNSNEDTDLFHFDLRFVDQYGKSIKECNRYPTYMGVTDFFYKRINFQINSTGVEYIVRRSNYENCSGFQNYDLAWCADDATWIKFGSRRGIATISGPKVSWRLSGANISSNMKDKTVINRKIKSIIKHMRWVKAYFAENHLIDSTTHFQKLKWASSIIVLTPVFSLKEKYNIINEIIKELDFTNVKISATIYLLFWEMKTYVQQFKKLILKLS